MQYWCDAVYLFRDAKSFHHGTKVPCDERLRKAAKIFDVTLEITFEENVHLTVVVIIMTDTIDALNVIPDCTPKW